MRRSVIGRRTRPLNDTRTCVLQRERKEGEEGEEGGGGRGGRGRGRWERREKRERRERWERETDVSLLSSYVV